MAFADQILAFDVLSSAAQVYQKLQADGTFEAKLAEMYRWGQQFGWEPVTWKDGRPQPSAPSRASAASPPPLLSSYLQML